LAKAEAKNQKDRFYKPWHIATAFMEMLKSRHRSWLGFTEWKA
jgi:hypothetical protein